MKKTKLTIELGSGDNAKFSPLPQRDDRRLRPRIDERRFTTVLDGDTLCDPGTMYWIGRHTKAFREQIARDPILRAKLCPRRKGEHHNHVSRRRYADAIVETIWNGPTKIVWASGQRFAPKDDFVDAAFGDAGFRYLSKLEALTAPPKVRAKSTMINRLRLCHVMIACHRPDWLSSLPR